MVAGMHLTPIGNGAILLEPGEGLDPTDPDAYLLDLMNYLQDHKASRLIYDLGDAVVVDEAYYGWLRRVNDLCRLAGMEMVAVNIKPAVAFTLAARLTDPPPFQCALDVDRARR